ncbi:MULTISPECIES: BCCT family transporter [Bacteroides]|jgi:choline-glycine betaine transporter|uniref:BCCT family transporter n=1 Tax=Bacteroides TaxID=816 RepID=UPI000E4CD142|nr:MULTISPECIES: BCCT family transporter [Bacteroides]RHL06018.1 hypothetical protein DW036_18960 [Bacteroides sp. AF39-11AC]
MEDVKSFFRNKPSALIALSTLLIIYVLLLLFPHDELIYKKILSRSCLEFRVIVHLFCLYCLIVLLYFSCSKYGNIRLGGKNAKPEFSTFSWLSCLFMSGCGIGIVFYNQESVLHLHNNPYVGNVVGAPEIVAYALTISNWTLNCWAQFGLSGLIIAYLYYNQNRRLKLSSILPIHTNVWVKRGIDVLMALGIIAGLTTSLGLGVTQIMGGVNYVFHTNLNPYVWISIIAVIATWSVTSGLKKGVKWLSNISIVMVSILMIIMICLGVFVLHQYDFLQYIAEGTGNFMINFLDYNNMFDSTTEEWNANYPIFTWLWFSAWSAFVAVFVAKISRGRTIRQFIMGVVLVPSLFTILWFGIFSKVGLNFEEMTYQSMNSNISTAVFIFIEHLTSPIFYKILSLLILIMICLFFITSSDSGSYVVSTLLSESGKPSQHEKMFWSIVQCLSAMLLYWCGGLSLIQSASVMLGFVVIILVLIGSIYFFKIVGNNEK